MHFSKKFNLVAAGLAILCLAAAQLACSVFTGQGARAPEPPAAEESTSEEQSQPEGQAESQGEGVEGPVEPQFGSDTLDCPPKGSTLVLGFDHALTVNYQETSLTHFLHQGWINLEVADEAGTLVSVGASELTTSMEGRMSTECSITAQGTMVPNAHGSCEAGVVSLIIEENWGAMEGEMTCVDDDGDVTTGPFNVPPMGVQTHSGVDGEGEIFYLVEGSEGYSSMRPFAEGEGYHTWTLYTQDIPLVPLAP